MADLFVSYSRRDDGFGRKLHARLTGIKRDVWMDWEDIPFNSDWWQEIKRGIETSDNFLIVLSNDFVTSPVCMLEVDYARKNNKRILVIAHNFDEPDDVAEQLRQRSLESETVQQLLASRDIINLYRENWTTIGHVNWLFFNDDERFDENFHNLVETMDTDLNHVRTHTNLQVSALEWDDNDRNWSFLLTGVLIDQAEEWIKKAEDDQKRPVPTKVQREFIAASRQQQIEQEASIESMQTRARRFRRASIVAGIVAAVMIIVAFVLSVVTSTRIADAQADIRQAQNDRGTAQQEVLEANVVASEAGATLIVIPVTFEAINAQLDANNTQVAAVGETLTPVFSTLVNAEIAQQAAEADAMIAATAVADANVALADANASLTPVSVTLTQSADAQATAIALVGTANADSIIAREQLSNASARAAEAERSVGTANANLDQANAFLTPIAATLTRSSEQIADVNEELAMIPPTLTVASTLVNGAETEVARSGTQIADAELLIATANAQNRDLSSTAASIRRDAELNRQRALSQSLVVDAEQANVNGDVDLALALLLESYNIAPNLPQTRRLLNSLAYTSARFVLPDATFVTFNPDSSLVAYGDGKEVVILDIEQHEEIYRLSGHSDLVVDGEFSATRNIFVTGSVDSDVIVWNTNTWEIETRLTTLDAPINDIAFDERGEQFGAITNEDDLIIWDATDSYLDTPIPLNDDALSLSELIFFADGSRMLVSGFIGPDPIQYRLSLTPNISSSRFTDQIYSVVNPAVNRSAGQFVNVAMIETESFLTVYSLIDPDLELRFTMGFDWRDGADAISARAFNSNGSQVVVAIENGGDDTSDILILSTSERERSSAKEFIGEAEQRVTALAFSPDGRTVLSGFGRYLVLWDTSTGRELRRFGAHVDDIVEIEYSLDSNYAITRSRDGHFRVWDVSFSDPAVLRRIEVSASSGVTPSNPGLSPNGAELYFNIASDINRLRTLTGNRVRSTFSWSGIQDIFYSPVDNYAVTTTADTPNIIPSITIWDLTEQTPDLWSIFLDPDDDGIVDPIGTFSADGRQIVVSLSSVIRIYDVTDPTQPEIAFELDRTGLSIGAFAFSPDGGTLYAAVNAVEDVESYELLAWDLLADPSSMTPTRISIPHTNTINAMAINEAGTQILTASDDQTLILFDLEENTLTRRLIGHRDAVTHVHFGLDDQVALSTSADGTLNLWDLGTGQSVREYVVGTAIDGLALSNNDRIAVITDQTSFVTVWEIETLDDVVEWIRDNRDLLPLTDEQCRQYDLICDDD